MKLGVMSALFTGMKLEDALGYCRNVGMVKTDEANNEYMVSTGPISAIHEVRDEGVALNLAGDGVSWPSTLADGEYAVQLATGLVRFANPPAGLPCRRE